MMDIFENLKRKAQINLHDANLCPQYFVLKTQITIFFLTTLSDINILS